MWERAFVQSFIEVLPLISPLMQFKIKEMKGKADCEWFYKQDSQGALRRQFCKRLWLQSLERTEEVGGGSTPELGNMALGCQPHLSAGETDLQGSNRS